MAIDRSERRLRLFVAALAAAVLLIVGMALGRASSGAEVSPSPSPETSIGGAVDPAETAVVALAGQWLSAVDTRDELLDQEHVQETVARLVSTTARPDIATQLAQAAVQLRAGADVPAPTVRSAPLGYRIISLSSTRAVISTWEVVTRGGAGVPPSVLWARTELTLVQEDGWKIGGSVVRVDQPRNLNASDLSVLDERFRAFAYVP
jgi:hypothetical protein